MKFRIRLTILLAFTALIFLSASSQQPPTPASTETQNDLAQALAQRLQSPGLDSLTLDLFSVELDTAFLTPDGNTALLWLALKDDEGIILATEPGLALAQRTDRDWQVFLPGDARWDQIYALLPTGFLPGEHSPLPDTVVTQTGQQTQALTGYYLPYAAGTSHFLEGSIGHFQSIPWLGYPSCPIETCRYAYDFTDTWRYPLLASKGGVVFSSRDVCINGSPYCTNYIVLREPTTNTYQIYLHLANGTVPDKLTPGTTVLRGQYLGNIDDTGYSTSQHVHFMVTDSVWLTNDYYSYYWGRSIDIRFADVSINQGIPRTCYEVTQFSIYDGATECLGSKSDPLNPSNDWFVSGNIGAFPPTGHLTEPVEGQIVVTGTAPIMDVTASLSDDVGVVAVQLLAKLGGSWKEVGPKMSQAISPGVFDWDVDLCKLGPLNGTLEIALKVWDYEGNIASPISPISIQVDHACPPPISKLNQPQTFDSSAIKLGWETSTSGVALGSLELQWKEETGE